MTAETPIADAVLVEMLAGFAKLRDDLFVRYAVIEHVVDLLAESKRQAGDFAVASGFGLAGFELVVEFVR